MTFQVGKVYRCIYAHDVILRVVKVTPTVLQYKYIGPENLVDGKVRIWVNYRGADYEEVKEEMKFEVNQKYQYSGQVVTCTAVSTTGKPIFITREGKEFVAKNPDNYSAYYDTQKVKLEVYRNKDSVRVVEQGYGKIIGWSLDKTIEIEV